jgi:ATP-dependent protease ClpP protease subunit
MNFLKEKLLENYRSKETGSLSSIPNVIIHQPANIFLSFFWIFVKKGVIVCAVMADPKKRRKRKNTKTPAPARVVTPPISYYVLFYGDINSENATKLIKAMRSAALYKADRIIIFFSSAGGSIYEGFKLASIIQNSKIPVMIHATSNIDSIANVIYLSSQRRSAESYAKFYMHGSSSGGGDKRQLKDNLLAAETNDTRIAYFVSENTDYKLENVKSKMEVGTSIPAQEALQYGITHEIVHKEIPDGALREDIVDTE